MQPNPQYKIKPGTTGTPEFPRDYVRVSEEELLLEQQQQREAKKANVLPQRNADGGRVQLEGGGGLARAKDAFINWFSSTYLGDKMDPAESAVDKMPMVPTAPKETAPVSRGSSTGLPDALAGKSFKSIGDMDFGDGGRYQRAFDEARKADVSPASTKENPQYRNAPSQRKKADGGRVNYAAGATARVNAPEAPSLIDNFMDTLRTGIERLTGGSFESTAEPPQYEPARENPDRGLSFKSAVDPMYDSTLAELGPATQFRSNVQRAAEGGFIGEYNYAQPQQATMGTPFPNAVDSNPQQSQSFLQPNNTKKNSRVELADGTTTPIPKDKPPYALPLSPEQEELLNDQTFLNEFANGDREAAERIFTQRTDHYAITQDGGPEVKIYDWKLKKFLPYTDNGGNKTIGGINVQDKSHKLNKSKGVSISEYLVAHTSHLKKANDWVTNNPSYEPIREIIVDMRFNMTTKGFKQFTENRFGKAVKAKDFDTAGDELLIGENKTSRSNYYIQVGNRAEKNSEKIKSLGKEHIETLSSELSDSFMQPSPETPSVGEQAAIQNAAAEVQAGIVHNNMIDKRNVPFLDSTN